MGDARQIIEESLALPVAERAAVASELLASLDGPSDGDAAEQWLNEIERRLREIDGGAVTAADWEAVRARITVRLGAR
jgi:putative addiction module component (TIGR02574 family)